MEKYSFMKKIPLIIAVLALASCNKNAEKYETQRLQDTLRIIDSINASRMAYNDSIRALNNKNIYRDLSGSHKITHSEISGSGTVNFVKTGRDEYEVSGSISSGKNKLQINGNIELVTEKYLNFEGKIKQTINGKSFNRTKKTSFKDEKTGPYWRLQNKIGADGFVEYIDIHF